jgi:hypothetical protein
MTHKFNIILDILQEAFTSPVSEKDYHMIVACLRKYSASERDVKFEQSELARRGWPLDYNPCEHMERLRFAFTFGTDDNPRINSFSHEF